MSEDMQKTAAGRGTRKAHLSPELTEVLNMLKALEHSALPEPKAKTA
jgi:hypothetical protein